MSSMQGEDRSSMQEWNAMEHAQVQCRSGMHTCNAQLEHTCRRGSHGGGGDGEGGGGEGEGGGGLGLGGGDGEGGGGGGLGFGGGGCGDGGGGFGAGGGLRAVHRWRHRRA